MPYALIFLSFAIGQGMLVMAGATDGYFVGLWAMTVLSGGLAYLSEQQKLNAERDRM